jgi:hypothetical protein
VPPTCRNSLSHGEAERRGRICEYKGGASENWRLKQTDVYMCVYTHTHTRMYIYVHIHTHTNIYKLVRKCVHSISLLSRWLCCPYILDYFPKQSRCECLKCASEILHKTRARTHTHTRARAMFSGYLCDRFTAHYSRYVGNVEYYKSEHVLM